MNQWTLPTTLTVGGREYAVRTDFRAVLDVLEAFQDPDLELPEKWTVALKIAYIDYDKIPRADIVDAQLELKAFIDMGIEDERDDAKKNNPVLMDWEQDARLIIPAVNRVLGQDVRGIQYLHWWTFLSAYMEIGECTYSTIVALRQKKARGKKLEKYERDYIRENKDIFIIKKRLTDEEKEREREDEQALKDLIG